MSDLILKHLQGTSAQKPISANVLVTETGLLPATVNMMLDNLYTKHEINQATVTRNGITQREVWLTGVFHKIASNDYVINRNKPISPEQSTRRIAGKPIEKSPEKIIDKPINTANKTDKSIALQMLEYIELNPKCTTIQMSTALGHVQTTEANIPGYIKRGDVIVTHNEAKKKIFRLRDGITAKVAYENRRRYADPRKPKPEEFPTINFLTEPSVAKNYPLPETYEQLLKQTSDEFNAPEINIESPLLSQVGGSHYKDMSIQPITYILANNIGFAEGSIIKYISRYKAKNGLQDLQKAKHFIEILIEQQSNQGDK